MDIYITEKETGTRYALALLPNKVKHTGSAKFRSYDIINIGEVKQPGGTKLLEFSWSGLFPGEDRTKYGFIKKQHWRPPTEMQGVFERWRNNGTVLNLMVTETWINHDVLVSKFTGTPQGGFGDVAYEVTLVQYREIRIFSTAELNIASQSQNETAVETPVEAAEQPATRTKPALMSLIAPGNTYTVQPGDNLWSIAQRFTGDGADYSALYEKNSGTISHPDKIFPGQVITLT